MIGRVLPVIIAVVLVAPANARAVTIDDIVALSNAGVTDSILVAVIDADQTVFDLTPQQILELKQAGVSDNVVVKMVGTSREFEGRPMRREAPSLVIIGEKPAEKTPSPEPPPPAPSFTVITPLFVPAGSAHRGRIGDRRDEPGRGDRPPREQRDRRDDGPHVKDGPAVGSGLRQPSVCVRGGWVGWCGSE
jgi:hypothetical protein